MAHRPTGQSGVTTWLVWVHPFGRSTGQGLFRKVEAMGSSIRRFLAEPRPNDAPPRNARDIAFAVVMFIALVVELSVRDLPWRAAYVVACMPLPALLLIRRSHPLLAVAAFMGSLSILDVVLAIAGHPLADIWSLFPGIVLIYSAFRWGSGREAMWAGFVVLAGMLLDLSLGLVSWGDTVGGLVFVALTAETGGIVRRNWSLRQVRSLNARSNERERLARELHDTVAHHVSAIAVQAQAGRAVLAGDPDRSAESFLAIEESASRALSEMRLVVDASRNEAPLMPSRKLSDLDELAAGPGPEVTIDRSGDLTDVAPAVSAALYRIVQESITNARLHAPMSSGIFVDVCSDGEDITVRVSNDGVMSGVGSDRDGFGLTGMAERATLLGGSFSAGPDKFGGWITKARLPRSGKNISKRSLPGSNR